MLNYYKRLAKVFAIGACVVFLLVVLAGGLLPELLANELESWWNDVIGSEQSGSSASGCKTIEQRALAKTLPKMDPDTARSAGLANYSITDIVNSVSHPFGDKEAWEKTYPDLTFYCERLEVWQTAPDEEEQEAHMEELRQTRKQEKENELARLRRIAEEEYSAAYAVFCDEYERYENEMLDYDAQLKEIDEAYASFLHDYSVAFRKFEERYKEVSRANLTLKEEDQLEYPEAPDFLTKQEFIELNYELGPRPTEPGPAPVYQEPYLFTGITEEEEKEFRMATDEWVWENVATEDRQDFGVHVIQSIPLLTILNRDFHTPWQAAYAVALEFEMYGSRDAQNASISASSMNKMRKYCNDMLTYKLMLDYWDPSWQAGVDSWSSTGGDSQPDKFVVFYEDRNAILGSCYRDDHEDYIESGKEKEGELPVTRLLTCETFHPVIELDYVETWGLTYYFTDEIDEQRVYLTELSDPFRRLVSDNYLNSVELEQIREVIAGLPESGDAAGVMNLACKYLKSDKKLRR